MSATLAAAIAGGAIAAGSGIADTLINYGANKDLQHDTRVFNRTEAQKQRDWEQYMASTQYQRAIADMEAAGINPASMSGVNMQPSSVPSGSSASSSAPGFSSNSFGGMSNIINSAVQGLLANDRNASRILAREIQDNAKHGYRMEEMQEKLDLDSKLADYKQHLARFEHSAQHADKLVRMERKAELQNDRDFKLAQAKEYLQEDWFKQRYRSHTVI